MLAIPGDVGVKDDVEAMFAKVLDTWGTVDIVVNNGAWAGPISHILEMEPDFWDTVIRTNLTSIYLHCHRAANIMVDQGKKGRDRQHQLVRRLALAPLHGGLRRDQGRHGGDDPHDGDRPGAVRHSGERGAARRDPHRGPRRQPRRRWRGAAQTVPLGRVGYPDDIAGAVSWLVSDDASYVTGHHACRWTAACWRSCARRRWTGRCRRPWPPASRSRCRGLGARLRGDGLLVS